MKRRIKAGDFVLARVSIHRTEQFDGYQCWVVGVVSSINQRQQCPDDGDGIIGELRLSEIVWASCPDWRDYYPNRTPFNLGMHWFYRYVRVLDSSCLDKEILLCKVMSYG